MIALWKIPVWIVITGAFLIILTVIEYVFRENRDAFIRRMAGIGLMIFGFYIAFNWSLSGQAEKLKVEELTLLKTRLEKMENSIPRWYSSTATFANTLKDSIACSCLDQVGCVQRKANAPCPSAVHVKEALEGLSDVPKKTAGLIDSILQVNSIDTLAKSFVEQFEEKNGALHYSIIPQFKEIRDQYNREAKPTVFSELVVDYEEANNTQVEFLLSLTKDIVAVACLLRRALEDEYDVDKLYQETFEQIESRQDTIAVLRDNIGDETWLNKWQCSRVGNRAEG